MEKPRHAQKRAIKNLLKRLEAARVAVAQHGERLIDAGQELQAIGDAEIDQIAAALADEIMPPLDLDERVTRLEDAQPTIVNAVAMVERVLEMWIDSVAAAAGIDLDDDSGAYPRPS